MNNFRSAWVVFEVRLQEVLLTCIQSIAIGKENIDIEIIDTKTCYR